jgi:hypothetical protein
MKKFFISSPTLVFIGFLWKSGWHVFRLWIGLMDDFNEVCSVDFYRFVFIYREINLLVYSGFFCERNVSRQVNNRRESVSGDCGCTARSITLLN